MGTPSSVATASHLSIASDHSYAAAPWQRLYFLPLPQGHGSLRPTLVPPATAVARRFPTALAMTLGWEAAAAAQ